MKETDTQQKYLFGLGTFRLILAWFVIASHTAGYYKLINIDTGTIAVTAFFFISGYLMPLTFEKNYARFGNMKAAGKFYLNRFIRIYPIYWSTLLFLVAVALILSVMKGSAAGIFQDSELTFNAWLQNFFLIGLNQSTFWSGYHRLNNPAWTLDIELQYYLLVPLILILYKKCKIIAIAILVITSIGSLFIYFKPVGLVDIDRSLLAWAFFFFVGFLFYKVSKLISVNTKTWMITIFLTLLSFYIGAVNENALQKNFYISLAFMFLSVPLLLLQVKFKFGKLDKKLGDLSYPTYIIHIFLVTIAPFILSYLHLDILGACFSFCISLLITIILSTIAGYLALRFISDPVDKIRNKIRGKTV